MKRLKDVLAYGSQAVDPDMTDDAKQSLTLGTMNLATSLAKRKQTTPCIVHVGSDMRKLLFGCSGPSEKQIKPLTYDLQTKRRSQLIDPGSLYAQMNPDRLFGVRP